jgi:hypothetical protein
LERAKYDWIFLLNPDASVIPGCLGKLHAFLISKPTAGAVSPVSYWDHARAWFLPPGQMPSPAIDFFLKLAMCFPSLGVLIGTRFRDRTLKRLRGSAAKKLNMLSGGHILLRRSAITAAGGLFDDNIFMYFEDTDLCRRLNSAGYGLYLLPSAHAIHSWQCQPAKMHLGEASHRYYLKKHFPNSRWSVVQGFLQRHRQERLPASVDLGVLNEPPELQVPQEWRSGWVLECSAHPLMVPAAYFIGAGPIATFSAEVWAFLGAGSYWMQLLPDKRCVVPRENQRFAFRVLPKDEVCARLPTQVQPAEL